MLLSTSGSSSSTLFLNHTDDLNFRSDSELNQRHQRQRYSASQAPVFCRVLPPLTVSIPPVWTGHPHIWAPQSSVWHNLCEIFHRAEVNSAGIVSDHITFTLAFLYNACCSEIHIWTDRIIKNHCYRTYAFVCWLFQHSVMEITGNSSCLGFSWKAANSTSLYCLP